MTWQATSPRLYLSYQPQQQQQQQQPPNQWVSPREHVPRSHHPNHNHGVPQREHVPRQREPELQREQNPGQYAAAAGAGGGGGGGDGGGGGRGRGGGGGYGGSTPGHLPPEALGRAYHTLLASSSNAFATLV
jgi:hypothetical protein